MKDHFSLKSVVSNASLLLAIGVSLLVLLEVSLRFGFIENSQYERMKIRGEHDASRKILFVGDSFIAWDHYGREMFTGILNALDSESLAIVNAAHAQHGPLDYLVQLTNAIDRWEFDTVFVFYFVGNDVSDTMTHRYKTVGGFAWRCRLFVKSLNSYHYYLKTIKPLVRSILSSGDSESSRFDERVQKSALPEWLKRDYRAGRVKKYHVQFALSEPPVKRLQENLLINTKAAMAAWERNKELLRTMKGISETHGAKLSIVILPADIQVGRRNVEFYKALNLEVPEEVVLGDKPQTLLREFCSEEGLACLDLLPLMKPLADKQLYRRNDSHFSPRGNRWAAEFVADFVRTGAVSKSPREAGARE